IAQSALRQYGGSVSVDLQSSDQEEVVRVSDPQLLLSADIPRVVSRVAVRFEEYGTPLRIRLELPADAHGPARLTVAGSDPQAVSGLSGELQRELQASTMPGSTILKYVDRY